MSRGGKRPGAGRKPGSHVVKTAAIVAQAVKEEGGTPLEFLLAVMRDNSQPLHVRLDCARSAAPYIHPRLAHIQQSRSTRPDILGEMLKCIKEEATKRAESKMITIDQSSHYSSVSQSHP